MNTSELEALFRAEREAMVEQQIASRGVKDEAVLAALLSVPRHRFVDRSWIHQAYADHPLPIGFGQTISQPFMVARMAELCRLSREKRVLEVGAGSGYQTAVLAQICREVFAVEIVPELAERAARMLAELGIENAIVAERDGSVGWAEHSPYDAIVVAAGAPAIPEPLTEQLAEGGRLIIPVGASRGLQLLHIVERHGAELRSSHDTPCRFVDLQGRHGWGQG